MKNQKNMKPQKVIFKSTDTFETFRIECVKLIGAQVANRENEKLPLTIFNVQEIMEFELECIGNGFLKFLDGDINYTASDGGYNFKGTNHIPMWAFGIEYGMEDKSGKKTSAIYNFMIPRKGIYENDLKKCPIISLENHPFVFFET